MKSLESILRGLDTIKNHLILIQVFNQEIYMIKSAFYKG